MKFVWDDKNKEINQVNDYLSIHWSIPLLAEGNIIITDRSNNNKNEFYHSFSLYIHIWFHFDEENPLFNFDIHDQTKNTLYEYNRKIENIIKKEKFEGLIDEATKFDGKNSVIFFINIIRHENNQPIPFESDFDVYDDLARCIQDIVFAIGELTAYKSYISNFTEHSVNVEANTLYQYFPNFCDKRYLSTCSYLLQLFYNYWGKIGDLLAPYFAPKLKEKSIYFGTVINNITKEFHDNEYYKWLENFKEEIFSNLNEKRKQVVHYTSIESKTFNDYRKSNFDIKALDAMQKEKEGFTEYFEHHFKQALQGFYNALKLIEYRYSK